MTIYTPFWLIVKPGWCSLEVPRETILSPGLILDPFVHHNSLLLYPMISNFLIHLHPCKYPSPSLSHHKATRHQTMRKISLLKIA